MESQDTYHAVSGSEYDENEDDDVSTSDDDKIIVFDKNLQRYVYTDKKDYATSSRNHYSDYVKSRH
jgi:hypothetical protein